MCRYRFLYSAVLYHDWGVRVVSFGAKITALPSEQLSLVRRYVDAVICVLTSSRLPDVRDEKMTWTHTNHTSVRTNKSKIDAFTHGYTESTGI